MKIDSLRHFHQAPALSGTLWSSSMTWWRWTKLVPADERIANIIKQIADKICPSIKVTVDYPSRHTSGYMPILETT